MKVLCAATLLAWSFSAVAAEPCQYHAPRNTTLNAAGLQQLAIQIGPDELTLHGEPGLTQIIVKGTACASNPKWLPGTKLDVTREGATVRMVAQDGATHDIFSWFGNSYAYLKLDIAVPQALAVKLGVGSGDATASKLAALDATVGSGDLAVQSISGEFGLGVGSGDAKAQAVGSLKLSSVGSGDAEIDGVHGDAHAGSVGSGDLLINHVGGKVTLGSVGSGDAKLSDVSGSVAAQSIGSGDLVIHGAKGDITVGSVASGDVTIKQAGGNVHADSVGSGSFAADGVAGNYSVGVLGSGDADHKHVKGTVSVPHGDD
ncbi:MAG TPA: hypothetical protein VF264_02110 [Rhodanobacteraceae bacterium]